MDTYCCDPNTPIQSDFKMELTFEEKIEPVIGAGLPGIGPEDDGKVLTAVGGSPKWMPGGNVSSSTIFKIEQMDKAEYDALEVKDPMTVYLIKG